jgi:hypothetical protein
VQAKTPYNYVHEHNFLKNNIQVLLKYPPDGINLIPYMLPEYFMLPFKNVKVTMGATGRVLEALMVKESSARLPPKCSLSRLNADVRMLLHEYFGTDIPPDLKYLLYSQKDGLMQPFESLQGDFYELLGKQFPDYPIMLVSPDARVHAVCDLQGNFRFVAIGKYDTYQRFIANGPSLWHDIPEENFQLEWNEEHIKPFNRQGLSTILSETIKAEVEFPNGTSSLRPIIVRVVASKIKIDIYPRIFPSESAKLQDSKNPFLATRYEDKSSRADNYEKRPPSPEVKKVRLCFNRNCQAPLTTGHRCPCQQAWYCNKTCQSADWRAGHKVMCSYKPVKK